MEKLQKKYALFQEKGYYIFKIGSKEYKDYETKKIYKDKFVKLLNEKNINFKEIEIIDDGDKEIVIYNTEKVGIHIVNNIKDYIGKIISLKEEVGHVFYRGHYSWKYKFEPSIYRESNKNILNNEHNIFKDIISTKPEFFNDCNSCLEMLVKMQHHGLPTRLMDLTENPLIALFFACYSESDKEIVSEVTKFVVKDDKFKYYDSDTVSVLCNLAKQSIEFNLSEKGSCKTNINELPSVQKLLHDIREEKSYFKDKIKEEHLENYTVVVKAKNSIERIINQSGAFVLFGMNKSKDKCSDLSIINDKTILDVILIPSNKKKQILEELNLLNINQLTVFCDLDNAAKYFKSKYN